MYKNLIIGVLACLLFILLSEGLPGLTIDLKNMLPSKNHSSQYNLGFWLMLLIGIIAFFNPKHRGQP